MKRTMSLRAGRWTAALPVGMACILAAGLSMPARVQAGKAGVATAASVSITGTADQIDQWIRTYLGRPPRNFETEVWMAELSRGRSMANVQAGILSSSELFERCGRSRDIYVSEVFRLLYGRSPTAAELANLQTRYDQALGVRLRFAEGLLQQPR